MAIIRKTATDTFAKRTDGRELMVDKEFAYDGTFGPFYITAIRDISDDPKDYYHSKIVYQGVNFPDCTFSKPVKESASELSGIFKEASCEIPVTVPALVRMNRAFQALLGPKKAAPANNA